MSSDTTAAGLTDAHLGRIIEFKAGRLVVEARLLGFNITRIDASLAGTDMDGIPVLLFVETLSGDETLSFSLNPDEPIRVGSPGAE